MALRTFGELPILFSTNVNLLYLLYSTDVLFSAFGEAKLLAENFSKNSNVHDSDISLPVFLCRTNLKLHNISVTSKMVTKVIMKLDFSKTSGPDYVPVLVLKNCEPELSHVLAELFNSFLNKSSFPDCWKAGTTLGNYFGLQSTCSHVRAS